MNSKAAAELASKHLGQTWDALADRERRVLNAIVSRLPISRPARRELDDGRTLGERLADGVARFGGSWTFIGLFFTFILAWMGVNSMALLRPYDPFPYILLNLVLSCLAAIQAPVILMSQGRQADKDRRQASHDYEVNLKAEIEIMQLHEKVELIKAMELTRILEVLQNHSALLETLLKERNTPQ